MRSLLALACLCALAIGLEAFVELPVPTGDKKETSSEEVIPGIETAETFSNNLASNPGMLKPEIILAYDPKAELENWQKEGNPHNLYFYDDHNKDVVASVTAFQPVNFISLQQGIEEGVKFYFFNKYDEDDLRGKPVTDSDQLAGYGWDAKLPLKVIIHGFTNSVISPAIQVLKNAYLKTGKYNVIAVDWGRLCGAPWYNSARANVPVAGASVGEFLDKLVNLKLTEPALVHILGHSLGAHVAGIAGKSMTKGSPARITGLDPAGPLFVFTKPPGMLYHSDADLVDVYHSNAGWLGKSLALGDADFYLNGGFKQPGCGTIALTGFSPCAHSRSYEFFAETILKGKGYEAKLCPHLPDKAEDCVKEAKQPSSKNLPTAESGYPLHFTKGGTYYVSTLPPPGIKRSEPESTKDKKL